MKKPSKISDLYKYIDEQKMFLNWIDLHYPGAVFLTNFSLFVYGN